MNVDTDIRTARPADLEPVAATLAEAFHDGDLAPWLVPDPDERMQIYPPYFELLVGGFLTRPGARIDVYGDYTAIGVWAHVDDEFTLPIRDYPQRLAACCGPHTGKFTALDEAMEANHPYSRPHAYLAFLGVVPKWRGRGIGSRLLDHRLTELDGRGRPAYLEATGLRNAELYRRHGFHPLDPIDLDVASGARLYPMHRLPHAHPSPPPGPPRGAVAPAAG